MPDWDACLASVPPAPLVGTLLRLVENQEQIATNQLVDSLAQQAVLEEMLETTKPPIREEARGLHYLLATPFRYPPLKHGSRFGTRHEPSLFYGSRAVATVLAEAAYYRFLFWFGMTTPPDGKLDTQHTLFEARYRVERGLRLQEPPFDRHAGALAHPSDYRASQALGSSMRAHDVEAFEFASARDRRHGINVALYTPAALAGTAPDRTETWLCELTDEHVRFHAVCGAPKFEFPLGGFLVNGEFPVAA